eukprot:385046_1
MENKAKNLDNNDILKTYREKFYIPKDSFDNEYIYLSGNSLGLQPKLSEQYLQNEMNAWKMQHSGNNEHDSVGWPLIETRREKMMDICQKYTIPIIGAKTCEEIIYGNALTVNLHLLMASFYQPNKHRNRYKILTEKDAFPSDRYALASQVQLHGYESNDAIIEIETNKHTGLIDDNNIINNILKYKSEICLVLLGGVNYITGQVLNMKKIAQICFDNNIIIGFDLAHAVGNIPLKLHDWNVDFACFCTYKYLNAGPGSIGGIYIHSKYHNVNDHKKLNRLAGWWGHDKKTRFTFSHPHFIPSNDASSWCPSNPSSLLIATLLASLQIFNNATFKNIHKKTIQMSLYMEELINTNVMLNKRIKIINPKITNNFNDKEFIGCQFSLKLLLPSINKNKKNELQLLRNIFLYLKNKYIVCDTREPNILRLAPVPLYNTYFECYQFIKVLEDAIVQSLHLQCKVK